MHLSPRHHVISFYHAFAGLFYAFSSQPNFLIHTFISFIVIILGIFVRISYFEWLIVVMTIFIGLVIELINTAIESVADLVTTEWRLSAKHAKDTAAAAMLVYAIGAVIIGLIIFLPKLIWPST